LWNLFDGICFDESNRIFFLQMKTNSWAKEEPLKKFIKDKLYANVLSFNVTNNRKECKGKYKVFFRKY
jgi:hypothetical protein